MKYTSQIIPLSIIILLLNISSCNPFKHDPVPYTATLTLSKTDTIPLIGWDSNKGYKVTKIKRDNNIDKFPYYKGGGWIEQFNNTYLAFYDQYMYKINEDISVDVFLNSECNFDYYNNFKVTYYKDNNPNFYFIISWE